MELNLILCFIGGILFVKAYGLIPYEIRELISEMYNEFKSKISYTLMHTVFKKQDIATEIRQLIQASIIFYTGGILSIILVIVLSITQISRGMDALVVILFFMAVGYTSIPISQFMLLHSVWKIQKQLEEVTEYE